MSMQTYKVRVANTVAHYVFVDAKSEHDAYRRVQKEILNDPQFDWYGEASHIHNTIEVEEAE